MKWYLIKIIGQWFMHIYLVPTRLYQARLSLFCCFVTVKNEHVRGKTVNVFKVHFYNFILSVIYTAS